jgi:hypothetical protein
MFRRMALVLLFTFIITLIFNNRAIPEEDTSVKLITEATWKTEYKIIGYSYQGSKIYSIVITPENYNNTMLLTFAMHGFEDAWNNDGAALVQIAYDVIKEFARNPEGLKSTRLIVVPCVNPDGTWHGQSGNGFGRCNAQEIDINRDFDYYWTPNYESKYRTGSVPFSTPEAQVLRSLVLQEKPDIIIDFHGWLNNTYGDKELGEHFDKAFNIKHQGSANDNNIYLQRYFTGWASQYARTLIVEYPNPQNHQNIIDWEYSKKTINVLKDICNSIQSAS